MIAVLSNRWVQLGAALVLAAFFCKLWMGSLEEIGAIKADRATVIKANASNQTTISELERRIQIMIDERSQDAREREAALAQRDKELAAANRAADKARRERDALFRSTPGCEQLARLDIGALCPAAAKRLQERSRGRGNPDGGDPGRGG